MTAEVVTTLARLRSLHVEWDQLAAASSSPLLDHDWFLSCAEALHREQDLRIVAIRECGKLTAAAPLAREAGGGGRHLALLGAGRLYEPSGWLYSSRSALDELFAATLDLRSPILLHRVPVASDVIRAVTSLPRWRGLTAVRPAALSYGVDTIGTWSDFRAGLSTRTLTSLARHLEDAERSLGSHRIEELSPTAAEVPGTLEMFAGLELSGWKGQRGSSIAQRADLAAFFRSYCTRAAERGRLRVTQLSFGSDVAAAEIAVDAYGRRWGLKIAYREDCAPHAPGLQVVHASLNAAIARGLRSYEFLGSAEDWQRRWRPGKREYRLTVIYPWSLSGIAGACRDAGSAFIRRAGRQVAR
jgi:CelD/BcsL family acetyltransferase involved in cellulose biosynthesis